MREAESGARYSKKGDGVLCKGKPVKYAWIKAHKGMWSIGLMCKVLGVSCSGYYDYWARRKGDGMLAGEKQDVALVQAIGALQGKHRGRYGTPRMTDALRKQGLVVNHKKVAKVMRSEGLQCKLRKRFKVCTTDSRHAYAIAPNGLNRAFAQDAPNKVWVADITYIHTLQGWLYCALVMDLFSRKIVGWALDSHMPQGLTQEALKVALGARHPGKGLVHHSDRGSQYAATGYRDLLKARGIEVSMSRKGNCWDNAVMESGNAALKVECVNREVFQTREQATLAVVAYIGYYNTERAHSTLGYETPQQFEANWYADQHPANQDHARAMA